MIEKEIILNSRILIVDDQPANVLLLERVLQQNGYQHYQSITDSREVLNRFRAFEPDLLLLDLMMPKVDGYAVMNQLRGWISSEEYFPVLVITADASRAAKQKALTLGAKDFLTKPVDTTEAALRIYNLLETRWLHRHIQKQNALLVEQNQRLDEKVRIRTQELADAHKRLSMLDQTKSEFLRLVSHELRTPLNGLLGTSELLLEDLHGEGDDDLREMLQESRKRILCLADQALLLTQLDAEPEKFLAQSVAIRDVLAAAIGATSALAAVGQVALPPIPDGDQAIVGDQNLLSTAFQALLETAIRFSNPGDVVTMDVWQAEESVTWVLRASSGTLSESALAQFFDLFTIGEASTSAGHLGLGPAVAHRILTLFGGSVSVANRRHGGIEWRVACPAFSKVGQHAQAYATGG